MELARPRTAHALAFRRKPPSARSGRVCRSRSRIAARRAVAKDMAKLKDEVGEIGDEMWDNLWGRTQFAPR